MDTDVSNRVLRTKELKLIFHHVMIDGKELFGAERALLFMLYKDRKELWSQVATCVKGIFKVNTDDGIIGACVKNGELVNVPNA